MKNVRFISLLGVLALVTVSGCGVETEEIKQAAAEISEEIDSKKEEQEKLEEQEKPEEQASEEETPKDTVRNLHLKSGYVYDSYWLEEDYTTIISCQYPVVQLDECCAKEYPELKKELDELSMEWEDELRETYGEQRSEAMDLYRTMGEDFTPYSIEEKVVVKRADSKVVSVLGEGYVYYGGAHGSTYYFSENIDSMTGEELELDDVIPDEESLGRLLTEQLKKDYDSESFYPDINLEEEIEDYLDEMPWTLGYNEISFYIDPYILGPYAAGSFTVTLSFDECKDLIQKTYCEVPAAYAYDVGMLEACYYDIDKDGEQEKITFGAEYGEYGLIEKHSIMIDGNEFQSECYGYSMEPVFIHTEEGKNYIYIQMLEENDFRVLYVYDLHEGLIEKVGEVNAGWYYEYESDSPYIVRKTVFSDPNHFRLATRTDSLSSVEGYKNYKVGADGMPQTEDALYYVENAKIDLTFLQDVKATVLDSDTGAEMVVKTGTKGRYIRTDNEKIADLCLEDGTEIRLEIECSEWPRTINGIDIEEIFEGLLFAG